MNSDITSQWVLVTYELKLLGIVEGLLNETFVTNTKRTLRHYFDPNLYFYCRFRKSNGTFRKSFAGRLFLPQIQVIRMVDQFQKEAES